MGAEHCLPPVDVGLDRGLFLTDYELVLSIDRYLDNRESACIRAALNTCLLSDEKKSPHSAKLSLVRCGQACDTSLCPSS